MGAVSAAARTHRKLAAASLAAVAVCSFVATAAGSRADKDSQPPSSATDIRVTAATESSVALVWTPSTDDTGVTSYEISGEVRRARVKDAQFVADRLGCGESLSLWITAQDRAGNRSKPAQATVSTSACADATPPTPPDGFRQSTTSQSAVILLWEPSTDDRGVVGYGIYRAGLLTSTTPEPSTTISGLNCGSTHEIVVDAYDAAGNR